MTINVHTILRLVIANYYTLRHVAAALHERIAGFYLRETFSQSRKELVQLYSSTAEGDDEGLAVVCSCEPTANAVYLRERYARARRNSVGFFDGLTGARLDSVAISPADREIRFRFSNGVLVCAQMFGSRANVLMCDPDRVVQECFLRKVLTGVVAAESVAISEPQDAATFRTILRRSGDTPHESLQVVLKRLTPRFSATLLRELFFRSGFGADRPIDSLTDRDIESLYSVRALILSDLLGVPSPRIYFDEQMPVEFSVIPLLHLAGLRSEPYEDIHTAIRQFIGSGHKQRDFHDAQKALLASVRRELTQVERTLSKVSTESADAADAERLERMGRLLSAHLHTLTKGMKEAIVEDTFGPASEPVIVPLDPHLSPAKNAERYYDRSKKVRHTVAEQAERRQELEGQRTVLVRLVDELEEVSSPEALGEYGVEHTSDLSAFGIRMPGTRAAKAPPPPPFRVFTVTGGFQVWAGKSGENNDLLSTRHTGKDDLWFHARSVGGSHVVLKVHTGKGEVSRNAIEQAAAIAAFYSKMKNAGLVSVTMCEGKYVRKPKGVPAGTVMVERERTILIKPGLPDRA